MSQFSKKYFQNFLSYSLSILFSEKQFRVFLKTFKAAKKKQDTVFTRIKQNKFIIPLLLIPYISTAFEIYYIIKF